ncbi:DUF1963 domain-containing protein [Solirubrobacter sp. CPCC 204708]|uniref:YwqG family protein n=1 Tax=Solirubrobacter deserti TaxID=2282478 RepID=A0ABT4RDA6_9ACTN|nr:DUF1963 domain-containing protein [Solirubrobacter deserti]MBE2314518.1 DUF1963 domain-containing protein [Solirubrobacter deserti]MDA0136523.1 YwqG family protein [Solirubrobacter deserti]
MSWDQDLEEVRRQYAAEPGAPLPVATTRPFDPALLPLPIVAHDMVPADPGEIGFDAQGRPVAATSGSSSFAWEWRADGSVLERAQLPLGPRVQLIRRDAIVSVDLSGRRESVQRITWDGDVAVRADEAVRWEGGGTDVARRAFTGRDGTVQQVRRVHANAEGDFEAGLTAAARLFPVEVHWTATGPLVWPGLDAARALVEPLTEALDRAFRDAAAESAIEDPFLLHVVTPVRGPALPPTAYLAGAAWRAQRGDTAARNLWQGVERGLVAELSVKDRLDTDALRACALLSVQHPEAWDMLAEVQLRLAKRLEPGAGRLAVVDASHGADALSGHTGGADVDAFRRALGGPVSVEPVQAAMTDRDALAALLDASGLDAQLAYDVAEEGLALVPGDGRSHFGAPALLPPGEAWPDGHTFLAAIDLTEAGRGTGWLLFFADLDRFEWMDHNRPGTTIRVFACAEPVVADGPCIGSRALAFRPLLQLPSWYTAREELGLDDAQDEAYSELCDRMIDQWPEGWHWFGGLYTGIQSDPPEPAGTVLLLHLDDDDELNFMYGDGGSIQFRIPPAALSAGDWSKVTAVGCSS